MVKRTLTIAFVALAAVGSGRCAGEPRTAIEQLIESRRLTDELLLQHAKMTEAGNRAVMADTELAASEATRDVDAAAQTVQRDSATLAGLLTKQQYTSEGAMLDEFQKRFSELRDLDREILDLASLDTNLKAQRLSFGPAEAAADALRDALAAVAPASPTDAWQVRALTAEVMSSVREIQTLQAPHIAEANDDAMTALETRMNAAEASARKNLNALAKIARPESRGGTASASARLDEFLSVHAEILKLSRRNSNVRALALSLGRKRTLAAACEERLRAIQDALAKRDIGPSR